MKISHTISIGLEAALLSKKMKDAGIKVNSEIEAFIFELAKKNKIK